MTTKTGLPGGGIQPSLDKMLLVDIFHQGNFHPFFGAGASTQRSVIQPEADGTFKEVTQAEWMRVSRELRTLQDHLAEEAAAGPPEAQYVQSVARSRGIDLSRISPLPPRTATEWESRLDSLRTSLARLGVAVALSISDSLSQHYDSLSPVQTYTFDLSGLREERWEALTLALGRSICHLAHLTQLETRQFSVPGTPSEAPPARAAPRFHSGAVGDRMRGLAALILGPHRYPKLDLEDAPKSDVEAIRSFPKSFEPHTIAMNSAGPTWDEAKPSVRLDEAEWVSDLLWYTYRYQAKFFPSTRDLAFSLSLNRAGHRPPAGELPQAAEGIGYPELIKTIDQMFAYAEEGYNKDGALTPTFLYTQSARAMRYCFARYAAKLRESSEAGQDSRSQAAAALAAPPLIYTTNFDHGLEDAFAFLRINHHVLYPIRREVETARPDGESSRDTSPEASGDRRKIEWVMSTTFNPDWPDLSPSGPQDYRPNNLVLMSYQDGRKLEQRFPNPESLLGPVIVKLHGSPCDPLGVRKGKGQFRSLCGREVRDPGQFRHFVVLPESAYLEAIAPTEGHLPAWLDPLKQQVTGSSAYLWFLGYSVTDWNIRLQLYRQIRNVDGGGENRANLYVVDSYLDPFRIAFLRDIEVQFYHMELNKFAERMGAAVDWVEHE